MYSCGIKKLNEDSFDEKKKKRKRAEKMEQYFLLKFLSLPQHIRRSKRRKKMLEEMIFHCFSSPHTSGVALKLCHEICLTLLGFIKFATKNLGVQIFAINLNLFYENGLKVLNAGRDDRG